MPQLSLFGPVSDEPAPLDAPIVQEAEPGPDPRTGTILFGADPTDRIVAVEPLDASLVVWRRRADDTVERAVEPFTPWLALRRPRTDLGARVTELQGEGFAFLHEWRTIAECRDARARLRDEHAEMAGYASGTRQALVRSGRTLFKGMSLADVMRMQVDIETESLSSEGPDGRVIVIAVGDNRGLLETLTGDEPDLLRQFLELVATRDPDVIEGHNIYGFDLPFLMARARYHNMALTIGRDGVEARAGIQRNFTVGGITRPFTPIYLHGRHVIDTFLAVQRFDWARGDLTSYGLKEVARAFGIAEEERVEIPRGEVGRLLREDRERVLEYARHDILETARLAELVTPTEFYQTQMVPDSYGGCAVGGTGDKINSIFVRAYLAAGRAIPVPQTPRPYAGGYTEVRALGVLDRVVKADVESLYPSIMLAERIRPESDTLDVFLPALAELTRRRFDAKGKVRQTTGTERRYWDGLQGSFKVLINSFYGYLGAPVFNLNDYGAASRVTERGREIVKHIAGEMERTGSKVIEIDTDGVYFVPPEHVADEAGERDYVAQIGSSLPNGIRLAFDGRFRAMVSLKTKNYVLWGYDGSKTFRGASMRSRADEPFGREFLAKAIDLLLERRTDEIAELYASVIEGIRNHRLPVELLTRRERVTEKTFTSSAKQRAAAVAAGVAVGDYVLVYERASGALGKPEQYTVGDANAPYYMEKLYKFAGRLREALGDDFDRLIPRPTAHGLPNRLQGSLDLF